MMLMIIIHIMLIVHCVVSPLAFKKHMIDAFLRAIRAFGAVQTHMRISRKSCCCTIFTVNAARSNSRLGSCEEKSGEKRTGGSGIGCLISHCCASGVFVFSAGRIQHSYTKDAGSRCDIYILFGKYLGSAEQMVRIRFNILYIMEYCVL